MLLSWHNQAKCGDGFIQDKRDVDASPKLYVSNAHAFVIYIFYIKMQMYLYKSFKL